MTKNSNNSHNNNNKTGVREKLGGHARGIRLEDRAQSSLSFSCFPIALDGSKEIRNET